MLKFIKFSIFTSFAWILRGRWRITLHIHVFSRGQ